MLTVIQTTTISEININVIYLSNIMNKHCRIEQCNTHKELGECTAKEE